MPSKDVVGYPPRKSYFRIGLEKAWLASFKALDIGSSDFPTFEDFLINGAADRTYADALAQIEKIALGRTESSLIKESKELEETGGIEQYSAIADELRQSGDDYRASAIELLISELIAERNKPKPKRASRAKPAPKPPNKLDMFEKVTVTTDVPAVPEHREIPASFEFGKDFRRIQELIIRDGTANIKLAKELLAHGSGADLTEADRQELLSLVSDMESGIKPLKEPTISEIHKKKVTKIRKSSEIFEERERKEARRERIGDEEGVRKEILRQTKETEIAGELRQDTVNKLAQQVYPHINEILTVGLRAWIESRSDLQIRVSTGMLTLLAAELLEIIYSKLQQPTDIPTWLAVTFIQQEGSEILAHGAGSAMMHKSYVLRNLYNDAKSKKPDIKGLDELIPAVQRILMGLS